MLNVITDPIGMDSYICLQLFYNHYEQFLYVLCRDRDNKKQVHIICQGYCKQ